MGGVLIGGGGGTLSGTYGGPPRRGAGCGRAANVGDAATGGAMAERCVACGPASAGGMADRHVGMVTVASKGGGAGFGRGCGENKAALVTGRPICSG